MLWCANRSDAGRQCIAAGGCCRIGYNLDWSPAGTGKRLRRLLGLRKQGTLLNGKLVFSDEFNGGSLDRSKWNVIGPDFWINNKQQAYFDTPDTIRFLAAGEASGAQDGVLVLQPHFREGFRTPDGRSVDFMSGRIDTRGKFEFTHGRAVARIRMPDAAGVWAVFWLLGNGKWPDTGEIDIMEYVGEKDWIGVALHGPDYSGDTPLVNKYFSDAGEDVTSWHEYAVGPVAAADRLPG